MNSATAPRVPEIAIPAASSALLVAATSAILSAIWVMPGNFSGGSFSGAVGGFSVDQAVVATAPRPSGGRNSDFYLRGKLKRTSTEILLARRAYGLDHNFEAILDRWGRIKKEH